MEDVGCVELRYASYYLLSEASFGGGCATGFRGALLLALGGEYLGLVDGGCLRSLWSALRGCFASLSMTECSASALLLAFVGGMLPLVGGMLLLVGGMLFALGGEFLEFAHAVTVLRGGYEVE